jgi:hypothetical protein
MIGEEPRRILTDIAADYDLLRDLALTELGPSQRHEAIDVLLSTPFTKRRRNAKE